VAFEEHQPVNSVSDLSSFD